MQCFRDIDVSPEAPTAFIDLATAKAYLGISDAANDALLTALTGAASQLIERFCNRYFFERTITETIATEDRNASFILGHANVTAVTSLTCDGTAIDAGDYRLAKTTGIIRKIDGSGFDPTDYVAVYTVGAADVANIPAPIIHATKELVKSMFQKKDTSDHITRESVPDVADVTYGTHDVTSASGAVLPSSVYALVAPYCETYTT